MTTTISVTEVMAYVLTAGSVASLLVMWLADWRERCYSRREITRFPMFAARDNLVRLVAQGVMSEDDHPWKWSYRSVAMLLRTHQKWHLLGVVLRYARYVAKAHSDPAEQKRHIEIEAQLNAACKAHPEFKVAQEQIGEAFLAMVTARTNFCHEALLWLLIASLSVASALLYLSVTIAPMVFRSLRNPNSTELAGFSVSHS